MAEQDQVVEQDVAEPVVIVDAETGEVVTPEEPAEKAEPAWQEKEADYQRKLKASERRADRHRQQAEYWRNQASVPVSEAEPVEREPQIEDFLDKPDIKDPYAALAKAQAKYEFKQAQKETVKEAQIRQQQDSADEATQDVQSKIEAAVEQYPDFKEVALKSSEEGGPTITPLMVDVMRQSPKFNDIAYYLGSNVEESVRISNLPPALQSKEIGKLEARFESEAQQKPAASRLPAPVKTLGGRAPAQNSLEKMTMAEYAAHRNAQLKKR